MKELAAAVAVAAFAVLAINGVNVMPYLLVSVIGLLLATRFELFGKIGSSSKYSSEKGTLSDISFDVVGGQDEAKEDLMEALHLLQSSRDIKLGIKPLGGILLQGPPGTGKTLMARAAANYTDSVFLAASGSEFVEMYAGVGAKRVRDLFSKARRLARRHGKDSALIFIDEMDVVGAKRGKVESHMEYDQTLNQLLVELDGIEDTSDVKIFVLAATNRADLLDEALLRPGRFDRIVDIGLPDLEGRLAILKIHCQGKPLAEDVDLTDIAHQTYGFSGAHLANLANEAAIQAMRRGDDCIKHNDFLESIDKVQLGSVREDLLSSAEKKRVAIHEAGHALISELFFPGSVSTVTVVPRSRTLGFIRQKEDVAPVLQTKSYLEKQLCVLLAGGAAEELVLGEGSTGAANDYQRAVEISENIIAHGLSRLGIINIDRVDKQEFNTVSREIVQENREKTRAILASHRDALDRAAAILAERERISGEEFRQLMLCG
ncbi:MAG: AAA family ATPase [Bacillota bacterium]|jgi:cell division protease FtsH|nr:AAA family ATPase [Bacillota bacterium]